MDKLNDLISKACLASELGKKGITVDLTMLSQVRDEFWSLKKRAEAAEVSAKEWRSKAGSQCAKREVAEATMKQQDELILSHQETIRQQTAKLAELVKQEPVAWMVQFGGTDREVFTDEQSAVRLLHDVSENGFLDVSISPLCRKPFSE